MVSRRDDFPKTIIQVTRELPVPDFRGVVYENGRSALTALVDRIVAAKSMGDDATFVSADAEVDTHIFRLYGLTDDEVELVQNAAR